MHAVTRGPEPKGLPAVRMKYTPRWVSFYRKGRGTPPTDDHWLRFQPTLARVFLDICAYCEEFCHGQVDHFKPKSRFPELVYDWGNWVYSCHFCNHRKHECWPRGGFVDPCSTTAQRAESYFTFDIRTGEILLRSNLSNSQRSKALQTRDLLRLNNYHHLKKRVQWIAAVRAAVAGSQPRERPALTNYLVSRERELSSITRQVLGAVS